MKNLIYLIGLILITNSFISCEKNDVPEKDQTQVIDNRSEYFGTWNSISITLNGIEQNFTKTLNLTITTAKLEATYSSWKIENDKLLFYKTIGSVEELSYTFIILEIPNNNIMKLKHIDPNNYQYILIFQKQ